MDVGLIIMVSSVSYRHRSTSGGLCVRLRSQYLLREQQRDGVMSEDRGGFLSAVAAAGCGTRPWVRLLCGMWF